LGFRRVTSKTAAPRRFRQNKSFSIRLIMSQVLRYQTKSDPRTLPTA